MKNIKLYLTTLVFISLFSLNSLANDYTCASKGDPKTITEQLSVLLEKVDLTKLQDERVLLIDFMINSSNEILVVATNDIVFDASIKSCLNYQKIDKHQLRTNIRYTIPVTFRKI